MEERSQPTTVDDPSDEDESLPGDCRRPQCPPAVATNDDLSPSLPPTPQEATAERTSPAASSPLLATANDATITKQRRRRETNSDDPNFGEEAPGAVQVDERAPHINHRFFRGLTRPGQRARAREERARRRQQQDGDDGNAAANNGNAGTAMAAVPEEVEEDFNASTNSINNSGQWRLSNFNNSSSSMRNSSSSNNLRGLLQRRPSRADVVGNPSNGENNNDDDNVDLEIGLVSATLVNEEDVIFAEVVEDGLPPPDSDVERIVRRLELRNANRVPVPAEVKARFSRLCDAACRERQRRLATAETTSTSGLDGSSRLDGGSWRSGDDTEGIAHDNFNGATAVKDEKRLVKTSPCILREDLIDLRNSTRLEVESRTKFRQVADGIKGYFGFRCHCKVLLHVFNRAVDLIDSSSHVEAQKRRMGGGRRTEHGIARRESVAALTSSFVGTDIMGSQISTIDAHVDASGRSGDDDNDDDGPPSNPEERSDEDAEWFYYKDFSFYNLKAESNYPWMRSAAAKSALLTLAFMAFTPLLWCGILKDENICPSTGSSYNGWLTSLHFATVTMATVGYGTTTVLVGENNYDDDVPSPENWRIFIAILFMILSLIVSVVGFQAGLETSFSPFRRRLDVFGHRVYEILRDASIVKGANDKHEDIVSRMRWAKFSQLAEICLIFLILNVLGVFALQLSLLSQSTENNLGEVLHISWMESLYWAVQTTTTIGYGDVDTPESLRWFMLFYLAVSTYSVGSAFGKLRELNAKLESMQRLYLWQQQEASYTMLADFSGRPDHRDGNKKGDDDNKEASDEILDPEIDQFEFTIASLVLLGKITSEDVRPILEKFKKLTGDNNKITAADVSGPIKKNEETAAEETEISDDESLESSADGKNEPVISPQKPSGSNAFAVGKKIAQAFREELLSSGGGVGDQEKEDTSEDEILVDHSKFRIPKNTYAIAIDDSKIQRKLLGKLLEFAGIPPDRTTIVGDGYDEIMGFEDFVVNFIENHSDNYVFLLVDENLDVTDENSNRTTISGSLCVENIRKRLLSQLERKMFALVRSANDSSSDISIYRTRAHGFLPKAPIKRDKVCETLAPLWAERFPPSEFGETLSFCLKSSEAYPIAVEDVECTPYDIAQKTTYIESLFQNNVHVTDVRMIHEQMHELKGDLLTMNSTVSVTNIVGHINLILVARSPETVADYWQHVHDHINNVVTLWQKSFCIPENTYAIAIDDSKIQRKLLGKLFEFMSVPPEQVTILGDGAEEIRGFEDFVVGFMKNHKNDYVFMIVDENLDVVDETATHESISGSSCVENIRKRLPYELERRVLALVRSANDSSNDISTFCSRAHGFLPKAPIRREKVNEVIAPIWLKRFPLSDFPDSVRFDADETISIPSDGELACTPEDIEHKLMDIDSLFQKDVHSTCWQTINDQLHMLKGDLLTLNSDASIISVLGMINLMLLGHSQDPDVMTEKWHSLRDRIYFDVIRNKPHAGEKTRRASVFRLKKRQLSSNNNLANLFQSTEDPIDASRNKHHNKGLSSSFVSIASSHCSTPPPP